MGLRAGFQKGTGHMNKGFIASGDRSNGHYGEPKARVLERGGELRDVTIVGTDASGKPQIWSTLPDDQVESVFKQAFPALAQLTEAE